MFVGTAHVLGIYTARLKNDRKNIQAGNNVQYFLSKSHSEYFENILKYRTGKWNV